MEQKPRECAPTGDTVFSHLLWQQHLHHSLIYAQGQQQDRSWYIIIKKKQPRMNFPADFQDSIFETTLFFLLGRHAFWHLVLNLSSLLQHRYLNFLSATAGKHTLHTIEFLKFCSNIYFRKMQLSATKVECKIKLFQKKIIQMSKYLAWFCVFSYTQHC